MRKRIGKGRLLVKAVAALFVVVVGYFLYAWNQYNYQINTPVNPANTEEVIVTVKKGDSIKKIADTLAEKKLILSGDSFRWYSKLNGVDKDIKTGRFPLNQSLNVPQIVAILTSDKQRQAVITIPEGSTVRDIDRILVDQKLINAGEYIAAEDAFADWDKYPFLRKDQQKKLAHPLEGYLFPDTYFVSADNFKVENLIDMQLKAFQEKVLPVTLGSSRSLDQIVNVAAMVEEEANTDYDRPIVAGIIWKRLDEKWALGIDATLLYLKTDREIDYKDLQEESPYNTRKNPGLPPGPITNPGLSSLKAAADPQQTEYYYYLTGKDGKTVYAVTDAQHAANKAEYL